MAYDPTADIDSMAADGFDTVSVTKGGTTVQGWSNVGSLQLPDGAGIEVFEGKNVIAIRTGALGALAYDDAVTVAGVAGKVREVWLIEDGKLQLFNFVPN